MARGGASTKLAKERAKRETAKHDAGAGARPEGAANDESVTLPRPANEQVLPDGRTPKPELGGLLRKMPLPFPLTNLDRVVYPQQRITKGKLLAYFDAVADRMLPHVVDRPLTLVRCPDGVGHPCFWQKHVSAGTPAIVDHVSIIEDDNERAEYMSVHDEIGMLAIVQLGTIEIHTWGCRKDKIERPDLLVFDLDPDTSVGWDKVVQGAFELRSRLLDVELESFVKTTGGKGVHVIAPIGRRVGWDGLKRFARGVADNMAADEPERYTTNPLKLRRKGKIFIDYLRNAEGATAIAPYAIRARAKAPVSTPIGWKELDADVRFDHFNVRNIPERLRGLRQDPWASIGEVRQTVTRAMFKRVRFEG
jgi:bifunctional non-homologous end joining protein LigD